MMKTMLTMFVLVALVSSSLAASMRHGSENAYDIINGEIYKLNCLVSII